MYGNKFKIGDKVKVTSGDHIGESLTVASIYEEDVSGPYKFPAEYKYHYWFKVPGRSGLLAIDEECLELIPKTEEDLNLEFFKESLNVARKKPGFKIGDIVNMVGSRIRLAVEKVTDMGSDIGYVYEVAPLDRDEYVLCFMESDIEFKYHDPNRENYYTESVEDNYRIIVPEESKVSIDSVKYKIGDKVDVVNGRMISSGTVIGIIIMPPGTDPKYQEYRISNDVNGYEDVYSEYQLRAPGSCKPKFKVGDVVNIGSTPDKAYVINEFVLNDYGATWMYCYEVTDINNPTVTLTYNEDVFELQYHDTQWAEYFTEGTHIPNDLPPWRGELYNFYIFYGQLRTHGDLQYDYMEDYNNDTIPPMFMEHILDGHSAFGSIDRILNDPNKARIIMKKLNIDQSHLDKMEKLIKYKINIRNLSDFDSKTKEEWRSSGKKFEFTGDEINFVAEVYKLDTEGKDEYGNIIYTDHYNLDMTNLQIMQAIKEAYSNAKRTGNMKMQPTKDRRIIKRRGDFDSEPVEPVKGKREYEGVSKKGLIIRFWYNFDLDLIETAYPVVVNNNVKKH